MGGTRFSFTERDMVAAQLAWWTGTARWQAVLRLMVILGLIYVALSLGMNWYLGARSDAMSVVVPLGVAVAATVVLVVVGRLMVPYRARRIFREQKSLVGEYSFAWDAARIEVVHDRGQSHLPWALFHRWMDGRESLLLYQSRAMFNVIPKRALAPGDLDEIVGYLRAAGIAETKRFGFVGSKAGSAGGLGE